MVIFYEPTLIKIMKAHIRYWACNYHLAKDTGYEHGQEVPFEDIFSITAFVFGMGLNVMLHHAGDEDITIYIDNKRFQQR